MGDFSGPDLISDLPQSIIETILIQLPIRDAVRTSILSRKWRYKWSTITQLVFDEKCYPNCHDREAVQKSVVEFITRLLFLHQGPIHKFQIVNTSLQNCSAINQWILFLSRNDIKDLDLELAEGGEFFRMPSCFFGCEKLTRLELSRCELDPPASFKGFSCLKSLNLHQVLISPEAIESLISSCPLLESLSLSYFDCLALTVCAPNLKYLCLEGEFKEICLVDTPLLVELSVAMYMTDDVAEHMEQSSTCNFVKFLGGVPNLERLVGLIDFTKYLSIGNDLGRLSIMYNNLETIEMYQVSFEDMKEILVVLRLITSSPNLKELHISGSSNISAATYAAGFEFWEKECPTDSILSQLKVVKLTEMSGVPHEIEFIKFLLGCSPALETMSIIPSMYDLECQLKMLVELMKFRRASTKAEIYFIRGD
ncbi:F-box/FBD/LRR-repeat protein [Trifolium pratense]|uniref:F-box/FBD/LRR-repeat protein n=2 Tax=Trifolium TaxID=3898 RepID=A0A2K3NAP3_TRIPR|nr:F-box/FBD/LRR-repeat protein At1g13570-like [Trifolium pratense]XP_045819035.1 F-box/FBD/LRR-repeat protein At1g13570-like [Trifolium pratense]PNY00080.1 F-box/FBD/LRR-repeat protein [Trifolium pratense]